MSENNSVNNNQVENMDDDAKRQELISSSLNSMTIEPAVGKQVEKEVEKQVTPEQVPKKPSKFGEALKNKALSTKAESDKPAVPLVTQTQAASVAPPQPVINPDHGLAVSGRIVGSAAKEPVWTAEQLQAIEARRAYRLPMMLVNESRRTEADPQQKYVKKNPNGTVTATSAAIMPNLPLEEFMLAIGAAKPDTKLKPAMYSDVIMIGRNKDWTLSQWVVRDVIMEPVPAEIRRRGVAGPTRQAKRTIGAHFARFGLPVVSLGPVFETLASSMPGLMDDLSITNGYYWHNASWGVNSNVATFAYKNASGSIAQTTQLNEAMEMMGMKSSLGVGTFAISVSCEYELQNGKPVANANKYKFSIKCHNFFHLKLTDYHGPPQTTAVGFSLSNELANESEVLTRPAVMSNVLGASENLFGGIDANPFMAAMSGNNKNDSGNMQTNASTFENLL
jgi:hypothetical protein